MADPFVGQLTLAAFNFAPYGWAQCTGQLMAISSNTALFSLLGVNFGGDGRSTFALPNLQGNCAVGMGQGPGLNQYDIGQTGGEPSVTLLQTEVPPHSHIVNARSVRSDEKSPAGNTFSDSVGGDLYNNTTSPPLPLVAMNTVTNTVGGSQPHNNMMPYLALNWIIALQGVFPPRS